MQEKKPKVAIVHDWLVGYAGGDRVVDCMHHIFPDAPIYTLVYDRDNMPAWFRDYDIRTTYIQKLPFATKIYRSLLPWMPAAFEALDLSEYDLVLSSCSSCSKGVITRPDAVHICYCHTPTRYVWDFYYTYRANANWLVRRVMPHQMHKLRVWDKCAADRGDYFIANSHYIAQRIKKYYRRDADVIYPCVHINEEPLLPKEDFYLTVGRLTWYKRVDLAVAACTRLGKKAGGHWRRGRAVQIKGHGRPHGGIFGRRTFGRGGPGLLPAGQSLFVPRRGGFRHHAGGSPERRHPGAGLWPRRRLRERTGRPDRPVFPRADGGRRGRLHPAFEAEGVACTAEQIRDHSRSFSEARFEQQLKDYCMQRYRDWQAELRACSRRGLVPGPGETTPNGGNQV